MKNKLVIKDININRCRIDYKYEVSGEWEKYFILDQEFFIEYSTDICSIPQSIAIIPFLANILPVAWVCDAEICIPSCDKAFYDGIGNIKMGYRNMFPQIDFKGKLIVEKIEENHPGNDKGSIAFFSGGVDAFNTLVQHANEHPTLITLWGADVRLEDERSWTAINSHLQKTASEIEVDTITVKSGFRRFINNTTLNVKVGSTGDDWYHGFQHGIGLISHAAPIAFIKEKGVVYIASSYTAADKGKYTCASDPTIDNYVKFGDTKVVHDGYDFSRQDKIHNITNYVKDTGHQVYLRVCYDSSNPQNCCDCEKCWRTILGIYAEKEDPRKYGFAYQDFSELCKRMHKYEYRFKTFRTTQYPTLFEAIHSNYTIDEIEPNLKWFYKRDANNLGNSPIYRKIYWTIRTFVGAIKHKIRYGQ